MAKQPKEAKNLIWNNVDATTMSGPLTKLHEQRVAAVKALKEKTLAFEEAFIAEARKGKKIDDDQTLRFSYRFGMAVARDKKDDEAKEKTGTFKL